MESKRQRQIEEPNGQRNAFAIFPLRHEVKRVANVRVLMGHRPSALSRANQQLANPKAGNVRFREDSEYCCYDCRWPVRVLRRADHNVRNRGVAAIGGVNPNVNSGRSGPVGNGY